MSSNQYSLVLEYIDKCFCRKFKEHLLSRYFITFIKKSELVDRVYLVPKDIEPMAKAISKHVKVLAIGMIIGWIKRGKNFIPSPHIFNLAIEGGFSFGCAVVAKSQGVKAFLYGNDLLISSIEKFLEPIEKGMCVAIVDSEDMRSVGIGRLVVDPNEVSKLISEGKILLPAVENIFDLGVLLRDESHV